MHVIYCKERGDGYGKVMIAVCDGYEKVMIAVSKCIPINLLVNLRSLLACQE